jgi:class 3 adenylate cyclase
MSSFDKLADSITRQIHRSRKKVTILFTDIEDSTRYWDRYGDVKGRMMVNIHNRLAFPVIRHFKGRVIKTIGDSIMASFKYPEDAVKAAAAIQQVLSKRRKEDADFQLRVRIGIHTGEAIVEDGDVFGNVVNTASRLEGKGKGNEILLSYNTASELHAKRYNLVKVGKVMLKGKSREITVYKCNWREFNDLTSEIRYHGWLPLVPRQKRDILLYMLSFAAVFYLIYLNTLRFFIADSEDAALMYLNPERLLTQEPIWLGSTVGATLLLLILLFNSRSIPGFLLHIIKGGFGFAVAFMLVWLPVHFIDLERDKQWNEILHESQHLFVQVEEDKAPIYRSPNIDAKVLKVTSVNDLLLLSDVKSINGYTWNKVLIAPGQYGWMERVTPRGRRVTLTDKFYFRFKDLYPFIFGLLGFLWGVVDFRIKPA